MVNPAPRPIKEVEVSNEIRRVALPVLAQLKLGSPDTAVRLAAAQELSNGGSDEAPALLRRALARERDAKVHEALTLAIARVDLGSADPAARLAALELIGKSANDDFLSTLQQMLSQNDNGTPHEPDARVRAAAGRRATRSSRTSGWSASSAISCTACRWPACCSSRRSAWPSPSACWASSTWPTARC